MQKTKPEKDKLLLEFLDQSNAIEGVYDHDSLKQALNAWDYLSKQKVITPAVVLKTHRLLMVHQRLEPSEIGYFRTVPVWIGRREAPHYSTIKSSIEAWCQNAMYSVFPVRTPEAYEEQIKLDHINYEEIHPFVDGNGRTGRMFMNWQRLKAGLPLLVIKASERFAYYKWFAELK